MFTKKLRNILRGCLQLLGEVFHPGNASQTQWLFPFWGPSTWQRCLDSSTTTCLNQQLTKITFWGWSRPSPSATVRPDCTILERKPQRICQGRKSERNWVSLSSSTINGGYKLQTKNEHAWVNIQTGSFRNHETFQKPITNNYWSVLYLQAYMQGAFPINCTN